LAENHTLTKNHTLSELHTLADYSTPARKAAVGERLLGLDSIVTGMDAFKGTVPPGFTGPDP
jgi:hypothetical protein